MRKSEFRLVLDQYNRQLGYFRDTAQKVTAAITAYAGLHAGSTTVATIEKSHRELFLVVGSTNCIRMADAHRALGQCLGPDGPSLRELGILRREPRLVALAWGSLYAAVQAAS